jgi:hypothetical protein
MQGRRRWRERPGAAGSIQNLIFERHAFRIVFLKLRFRGVRVCKDLGMIAVANLITGVDVNPNGFHRTYRKTAPEIGWGRQPGLAGFLPVGLGTHGPEAMIRRFGGSRVPSFATFSRAAPDRRYGSLVPLQFFASLSDGPCDRD